MEIKAQFVSQKLITASSAASCELCSAFVLTQTGSAAIAIMQFLAGLGIFDFASCAASTEITSRFIRFFNFTV